MKSVFKARKHHRSVSYYNEGIGHHGGLPPIVFTPACQHLPGFHIIPPKTPREWNGMWFIIDF